MTDKSQNETISLTVLTITCGRIFVFRMLLVCSSLCWTSTWRTNQGSLRNDFKSGSEQKLDTQWALDMNMDAAKLDEESGILVK